MTQIADEIVHLLAPVIGNSMAASAVAMQCKKMGIVPENLSKEKINEFAERFKMPLQIFAGEQMAQKIIGQIENLK